MGKKKKAFAQRETGKEKKKTMSMQGKKGGQ